MRVTRTVLATILVVVALVVQVSVLARLQLPGAVPDLLLLVVVALALVYGHLGGAFVGFGAGLLADIAPPADHAVGRYALVLCLVGYVVGLTRPETGRHRSATVPMLVVAAAAVTSTLLYAGVGTLVGDTSVDSSSLLHLILTATLYDLLLAPFAVPLVMAMARRLEDDPLASESVPGSAGDTLASWGRPSSAGRGGGLLGGSRFGKSTSIARQRTALLSRPRSRTSRIKGVKRL